jgi:ADP-heptose:LPS heptosyltransferase
LVSERPLRGPRRILVVVDDCGAGDALKATWVLRAVRDRYQHARITLLAGEQALPALERSQVADRIVVSKLHRRRTGPSLARRSAKALELLRLALTLGVRHDLSITCWWGSTAQNLVAFWACRGPRIGFANRHPRLLTSDLGTYDFSADEYQLHVRLLAAAGISGAASPQPELPVQPFDRQAVRNLLERHGLTRSPLVVLHTGSDWACQQWLPERWSRLADELAERYGLKPVFTGTASEGGYIEAIRTRARSATVSLAGQTTFAELGALLEMARLCVCVDSAAYVVARVADTPTVVLAGPSDPQRLSGGGKQLEVVNLNGPSLNEAIVACKEPKYPDGGCHRYECPMAGLRAVGVEQVMAAIGRSGALEGLGTGAQAPRPAGPGQMNNPIARVPQSAG